jgi:hypothetical protein
MRFGARLHCVHKSVAMAHPMRPPIFPPHSGRTDAQQYLHRATVEGSSSTPARFSERQTKLAQICAGGTCYRAGVKGLRLSAGAIPIRYTHLKGAEPEPAPFAQQRFLDCCPQHIHSVSTGRFLGYASVQVGLLRNRAQRRQKSDARSTAPPRLQEARR